MRDVWVGNCRECGSIPGNGHSYLCSRAEKPKRCRECAGTGTEAHQDGGPCPACDGKGKVGGARAKHEAEMAEMFAKVPPAEMAKMREAVAEVTRRFEDEERRRKA